MIATTPSPTAWEHYAKKIEDANGQRVWPTKAIYSTKGTILFKRLVSNAGFSSFGNTSPTNIASIYGFSSADMEGDKYNATLNGVSGMTRFNAVGAGRGFYVSAIYIVTGGNPRTNFGYFTTLMFNVSGQIYRGSNGGYGSIGDNHSLLWEGPINTLKSSWKYANGDSRFGNPVEGNYRYPAPVFVTRDSSTGDSFTLELKIYFWGHEET